MINLAVMASHNGSGFSTLHKAMLEDVLDIDIKVIITNNSNANVRANATKANIDNFLVNSKTHENPDEEIYTLLKKYNCEYLFLSGYMKKLSPLITENFRVINSHPSLLPKYGGAGMYGHFVHEAVIANNEKISGVTVHEVNEVYDSGEIILQKELLLAEDENPHTLEEKIKELEKTAIVDAFKKCLN